MSDDVCDTCQMRVDSDGDSLTDCAAGRYGRGEDGCCEDCGGCNCDGAC